MPLCSIKIKVDKLSKMCRFEANGQMIEQINNINGTDIQIWFYTGHNWPSSMKKWKYFSKKYVVSGLLDNQMTFFYRSVNVYFVGIGWNMLYSISRTIYVVITSGKKNTIWGGVSSPRTPTVNTPLTVSTPDSTGSIPGWILIILNFHWTKEYIIFFVKCFFTSYTEPT